MGILKNIFGNKKLNKLKKEFSKIELDVQRKHEPLGAVGLAIITASNNCFEQIKTIMDDTNNKENEMNSVFVFYEFIYFFMHLTIRCACSKLTDSQTQKLQEYLGPIIVKTAVDTFFINWAEDYKSRIASEFFNRLNQAELGYSISREIISENNPTSGDSLFGKLARNVSELATGGLDTSTLLVVLKISIEQYKKMNLDQLIITASKVL